MEKNNLHYEVLIDEGNAVARSFGLAFDLPEDLKAVYQQMKIDLPRFNGGERWELPMTSRFVIDRDGVIRHADFNPDYTIRPDPEETLAALRQLTP